MKDYYYTDFYDCAIDYSDARGRYWTPGRLQRALMNSTAQDSVSALLSRHGLRRQYADDALERKRIAAIVTLRERTERGWVLDRKIDRRAA